MFGFQKVSLSMLERDHLKNLGIEKRWLDVNYDQLEAMVADMPQKTKE
jgi:hypothetical protein